ncbi:hypothetical protein ACFL27_12000 [candidate division CSSED10-310 bacterium]|uniref:FecR protein domain-containing protein n=1 Tax=candidate division CSSED10-310 bacterium TaxID=2855610 RepID=A0ABV6YXJ5_UNCC1
MNQKKFNNKESQRELWYKIRISYFQLTLLIVFLLIIGIIGALIYFDKITYFLELKITRLETKAQLLIDDSKNYGAESDEIEKYQRNLNKIINSKSAGKLLLTYKRDLEDFIVDVTDFISKLQAYQKGYLAQIVQVVKDVTVNIHTSLSWEKGLIGAQLSSGDKVKTGVESKAEISTESGNILRVNPESMIIIKDLSRDRKTFKPREVYSITESKNADYHIKTRRAGMTVEDENAVINVKEESEVKINKRERKATISVYHGLVEVKNNRGEMKTVRTREALSISNKGLFQETINIPYPPELIEPLNLKVFHFQQPSAVTIKIRWLKHELVNKYRLQVATDLGFDEIMLDEEINDLEFELSKLERGNYFWRVGSISSTKNEIMSEFSVVRSFYITFRHGVSNEDTTPPTFDELTIKWISPKALLIEGKTEPQARLLVEDINISVKDDGTFRDIIPFEQVNKPIELRLYDAAGNMLRRKILP